MRVLSRDVRLQDAALMYLTLVATLVVLLVASYQASGGPPHPPRPQRPPLPYHVPLDPAGHLQLSWSISYAQQEVQLQLWARDPRHGLLLGMSDRGQLTDADLVLLWDNGRQSYFGDAWSDHQGVVTLDRQQDYQLLEAHHTPQGFFLLFKRPFSTCDPQDYVIEEGTVHFIYATLDQPICSLAQLNLSLLQTGVQRVLLLRPDTPSPPLPADERTLDVLAPDVTIPSQETTYWCHMYQLPRDMPKNHIVMYESVITAGNEAIVHHMEVFECAPDTDPDMERVAPYSGPCDSKMKPPQLNYCRHVLAAWALGAEPFYYPPDAGMPFGGKGSSRFLRLEVHYHNPLLISGRRDSSGIRLHYTGRLRRFDAGIMELGLVYTPLMAVPPRQTSYQLTGYCTSQCTHTALPPGGIFIFASQLHTHLAGRAVRTVLLRGGQEVEVVQEDKHFSTHYQIIRMLRRMVNVLPGDVLITRCTYNTEDRNNPTVGGFGIMEEMCVNYVHYYPRTQLELCKSHVDHTHLQKYFSLINRFNGVDSCSCVQPDVQPDVEQQFSALPWDPFSTEVLDSLYRSAPISMHCNQSSARLFPPMSSVEGQEYAFVQPMSSVEGQEYAFVQPMSSVEGQEYAFVQPMSSVDGQEYAFVQPMSSVDGQEYAFVQPMSSVEGQEYAFVQPMSSVEGQEYAFVQPMSSVDGQEYAFVQPMSSVEGQEYAFVQPMSSVEGQEYAFVQPMSSVEGQEYAFVQPMSSVDGQEYAFVQPMSSVEGQEYAFVQPMSSVEGQEYAFVQPMSSVDGQEYAFGNWNGQDLPQVFAELKRAPYPCEGGGRPPPPLSSAPTPVSAGPP
ncbi:hypothetical protein ACEWY4_027688 [Coilia grayii]|uniref:Dopamine beta-hydroxylase n=1 Tax=Coilia grayii TaxID=363190 RepID=A0ABD1INY4_9TELE